MLHKAQYYILVIEEEQSLSQAAKRLGITQPALSAHISKLEKEIGGKIYNRNTVPFRLTKLGRAYVDYVRKCYELELRFIAERKDILP